MLAVGIAMLVLAMPRQGEVVAFLRRDSAQNFYAMLTVFMLMGGGVIAMFGP
jgi:hypothetical protein